jgi:hypothetical protein
MKYILNTLLAAAAIFTLSACDDDDNWTAGEETAEDSPAVYFDKSNAFTHEFETDDHTFELTLKRLNTKDAVTVPLQSVADNDQIIVPSSVTFEAGQSEATITVDCTNIPTKQVFNFSITIPEAYRTVYGEGFDVYSGSVSVVEWVVIDPNFKYTYYDSSNAKVYEPTYGTFEMLEGSSKLKLTNFVNSGKDFIFTLDATQSGCSSTYIGINPVYNYYWVGGDYECWYFYDETNEEYPAWTMGNGEPITYFYAYGVGYSYFNLNSSYGCISAYMAPDEDTWNWVYVWFYFTIPDEYQGKIPYTK